MIYFVIESMYNKKIKDDLDCGILVANAVIGGKWKCCILDALNRNIKRPTDIQKYIPEASRRVIEIQISELLRHGLIVKSIETKYPKITEYELTNMGRSVLPIIELMDAWGLKNSVELKSSMEDDKKNQK